MTKHYCDVCSQEAKDFNRLKILCISIRESGRKKITEHFDVCMKCSSSFFNILHSFKNTKGN